MANKILRVTRKTSFYTSLYKNLYINWNILVAFVISYRKNSRVNLFQNFSTPYQLVLFRESHCHLSERSFSLVKRSAHARTIFRGFANNREKSGSWYVKMIHCTLYLYASQFKLFEKKSTFFCNKLLTVYRCSAVARCLPGPPPPLSNPSRHSHAFAMHAHPNTKIARYLNDTPERRRRIEPNRMGVQATLHRSRFGRSNLPN